MSTGGTPIPDPDPTGEYPDGWHPAESGEEPDANSHGKASRETAADRD